MKDFYHYVLNLAEIKLNCNFEFSDTSSYFKRYCLGPSMNCGSIEVLPIEWDFWKKTGKQVNAKAEFSLMTSAISDELLSYNRCIIHAVAFRYHDKAYLIAGKPGIGKSTHIKLLQDYFPGQFSIICGDRPILERLKNGSFYVHPSPWNGKENWYGADGALLAGIFCLERGDITSLSRLSPKEAVFIVYESLISNRVSKNVIMQLAKFENDLLMNCPVFKFISGGIPESAMYLYENMLSKEGKNEI